MGQMLNQSLNAQGFSPFFLHFGTEPRQNNFVSLRNISLLQGMDEHVRHLAQVQNVCKFLSDEMEKRMINHDNKTQHGNKYQIGDFVLLRKLQISGPRNKHKLKQIYYEEPFRIIKRYHSNVMLIPYDRRFLKNRLKGEGPISKNMCILARISRLKPIKNPLRLLHLRINEKVLEDFRKALLIPESQNNTYEMVHNANDKGISQTIIQKFNQTINLQPDFSNSLISKVKQPIKIQQDIGGSEIQDICQLDLYTVHPGGTGSIIMSQTTCSVQQSVIVTIDRLVPKYSKQKIQISESSFEEENNTSQHYSFDGSNISTDFYGYAPDCINLDQPIKADSLIFDEFVPEDNLCLQPITGKLQGVF